MATTPDSGASHVGFRIAMTPAQWAVAVDRFDQEAGAANSAPVSPPEKTPAE
jgi:hypothetical protein